jgi:hypothetical protein
MSDYEHIKWLTFLSKIELMLALKIQKKRNRLSRILSKLRATSPKKLSYNDTPITRQLRGWGGFDRG